MKKIFILLLIIPMLGFSQNDLVFNQVRNITLGPDQTATVPTGKAWKIESASPTIIFLIHNGDDDFGTSLEDTSSFAGISSGSSVQSSNAVWIKQGNTIKASSGLQSFSILEFNVVAASSGSGSDDTGSNTNNSDGFGNNSTGTSPGDDFTDSEGNTYSTTVVDGLVWTTSNANHSTYRDGTPIPLITDYTEWHASTSGAYTYFIQDETLGYGKLYNFHALMGKHDDDINTANKTFAPEGWRVPGKSDWINLAAAFVIEGVTSSFGPINGTGFALKSETGWQINGTNESGLNIKPSGHIAGYANAGESYGFNTNTQSPSTGTNTDDYQTKYWTNDMDSSNNAQAWHISIINNEYFYIACTTPNGGNYNNGLSTTTQNANAGNYVRLIKDAN